MQNLSETRSGQRGKISAISGDIRFLSRITSIGLTLGSDVEVLQNQKSRPLLVYARDTIIAINRAECKKIILEVLEK